jgi:hypothetical protein
MRPLPGDHQTLGAGRLGPLRLLRQPLTLVLGLRLHLVCTLQGLPVGFALAGAKADERQVLLGILAADPLLVEARPGQTLITDKHYYGRQFQAELAARGVRLLRPARKGEPQPAAAQLFRPLRQVIESINQPSRASWTWNTTAVTARQASSCGCCNASWP